MIVEDEFGNGENVEDVPVETTASTLAEAESALEKLAADPTTGDKDIVIKIPNTPASGDNSNAIEMPELSNNVTIVFEGGISADGLIINDVLASGSAGNDFTGNLTIKNNATDSQGPLTINLPAGSCTLDGGSYSSISETTADNTFVVGEDASIETLTVNNGNVIIYGTVAPDKITIDDGASSKIYWGAGTEDRLREVLAYPAEKNHGAILTADIQSTKLDVNNGAQSNQDGFKIAGSNINSSNEFVTNPYDGYIFDGNGHSISGAAYNNILAVYANNVTVKNLEVYQEDTPAKANAGISIYRVYGVQLSNVDVHNCGKAGVIVNASAVSASNLHTYSNDWGGVNVSKGGAPSGGPKPVFTFDSSCNFEETAKVYVDLDRTGEDFEVNTPSGWTSFIIGNQKFYTDGNALEGIGTESDPYLIKNASDLIMLEEMVNNGNLFEGQYIRIEADIDLNNEPFVPMGKNISQVFKGTLDGNGHTISNLYIDNFDGNDGVGRYYSGLFYTFNGTLKNLTIQNAYIEGVRASVLVGRMDGGTIDNCHVKNASIKGIQKNGAIAGFINGAGTSDITISNCTVKDCSFSSAYGGVYWQTGAISGYLAAYSRNVLIENNVVDNITIVGTEKNDDFYYMEQLYSHPFVGNVCNMSKVENAYELYTIEFKDNTVLNSSHNDLQTCDRTNDFFGWYSGDCNTTGYPYSSKVVVDGTAMDRFIEIERLASQIADGGNVTIYRDYELSAWGKSLTVGEGIETVLDLSNYSITGRYDVIVNNGNLTVKSSGEGKGKIVSTAILSGKTAIMNNSGAVLNIESGTIESNMFALLNDGTANITGGTLVSSSRNSYIDEETGENTWAYCVRTQNGGQMTFSGGIIKGIQGGLACQDLNSKVTISNDAQIIVEDSAPGKGDAFYALYTSWESIIEVTGGKFYSDRKPCAYASDEDQNGTPYGCFVLSGGKFSSRPLNGDNEIWQPESGFKYVETGDATYPYEIVSE